LSKNFQTIFLIKSILDYPNLLIKMWSLSRLFDSFMFNCKINQSYLFLGQILICKVLMLKSQQDLNYSYFDPTLGPSSILKKEPLKAENYGKNAAVYRCK
jgi:hypothetical protein